MQMRTIAAAVMAFTAAAQGQVTPPADDAASPVGGVAVVVGGRDGKKAVEIGASGRYLVRGLVNESVAEARGAIVSGGLPGVVTVDYQKDLSRLPFAESSVNLLVVDRSALKGGPEDAEIQRVLVPGGTAQIVNAAGMTLVRKAWDKGLDDWTHFSYGPEGNAVSKDTRVRPSNSLKFVAGVPGMDIRVARGVMMAPLAVNSKAKVGVMTARDAFNGVPLWRGPTGVTRDDRPLQWAADRRGVFHFPEVGPCAMVLSDSKTGQVLRTFDEGLVRPLPEEVGPKATKKPGVPVVLICGETLVQSYGKKVVALEIRSGKKRWEYQAQNDIAFMAATADAGRVFIKEVADPDRGRARWGRHNTLAITAIAAGKELWRHPMEKVEINDLLVHGEALYAFNPTANLGDDGIAQLYKFEAATGKPLWTSEPVKQNYNVSLFSIVIQNEKIFSWGPFNHFYTFDPATGAGKPLVINGYNQRCTRMSATENYISFGLTSWLDKDLNWQQSSVGRSSCAFPGFLAHGLTYYTYNVTCTCINNVRGVVALTYEEVQPVENADRLETFAAATTALGTPAQAPQSIVASEWKPDPLSFFLLDEKTQPVTYKDLSITADVHRHTLTATRGDAPVWSFTAAGRLYTSPVIDGDRLYAACADGYLYCVDAASGKLQWRFLAAPSRRLVFAYGQLESTWPIYNVVMHEGAVCVVAGRHAELDGGLWLWGLDPATGAVKWSSRIYTPPTPYAAGTRTPRGDRTVIREVASAQPLNAGLVVADGKLALRNTLLNAGGSRPSTVGYFAKSQQESSELKSRLLTIVPAEWDGKVIDARTFVELKPKK